MIARVEGGILHAVVWSPSGSNLAYTRQTQPGGLSDIFVMNADGTNQTNLTNTQSVEEWEVNWSPEGSKLAYTRHTWPTTRQPDIYVMNTDGTNPVNLTASMPEGMSAGHPDWSPDGTKIAFLSCPSAETGGACGIYVMNADGTNLVNITSAANSDLYGTPVWSPDGTKIAFLSIPVVNEEDCDIYVMNADGTNPVNITNKREDYCGFGGTGEGDTLDWQPIPTPTKAEPDRQQEQHQQFQQQQQDSKHRRVTAHPPDTGGPSLLLVASALLLSGGALMSAMVKRRI
jgi:Tol biopolymer transport system component